MKVLQPIITRKHFFDRFELILQQKPDTYLPTYYNSIYTQNKIPFKLQLQQKVYHNLRGQLLEQ